MGDKISALPAAADVQTTDIFPKVKAGVTEKATVAQLATALGISGALTDAQLRAATVPVSLSATENHIGTVGSELFEVTAEFTRPNDTTAYATGDVVSTTGPNSILTFTNAARIVGGSGFVTKAKIFTSKTSTAFRLLLFNTALTAIADNSPWTLLYADRASYTCVIPPTGAFGAITEGAGGTGFMLIDTTTAQYVKYPFLCAGGDRNLYGVIVTTGAYTPDAQQTFSVQLSIERN